MTKLSPSTRVVHPMINLAEIIERKRRPVTLRPGGVVRAGPVLMAVLRRGSGGIRFISVTADAAFAEPILFIPFFFLVTFNVEALLRN